MTKPGKVSVETKNHKVVLDEPIVGLFDYLSPASGVRSPQGLRTPTRNPAFSSPANLSMSRFTL